MPSKQPANKHAVPRFSLLPLAMIVIIVLGIALFTVVGSYGLALGLGVSMGAGLFLSGAVVGGRLGNARKVGQSQADVPMRLGACLALAGIAASAQGHDPPWAEAQRVLIGLGQFIASALALGLALHWVTQTRTAKEIRAKSESAAKPL